MRVLSALGLLLGSLRQQCVGSRNPRAALPEQRAALRFSAGSGLTFAQAEGDEAVSGVVRRKADGHAITRNHTNSKTPHPAGQLGRHFLPTLERNLVAAPTQYLVDTAGGLD